MRNVVLLKILGLRSSSTQSNLNFEFRLSKFVKYQEFKVQEPLSQLLEGNLPVMLNCYIAGDFTFSENLTPGTSVKITGILTPIAKFGYFASNPTFLADNMFQVLHLESIKNSNHIFAKTISGPQLEAHVDKLLNSSDLYDRVSLIIIQLSFNIAPEIYGHDDVKKALLLQLVCLVPFRLEDAAPKKWMEAILEAIYTFY